MCIVGFLYKSSNFILIQVLDPFSSVRRSTLEIQERFVLEIEDDSCLCASITEKKRA